MADAHSVLVIIGPSGSGKSTLVAELERRGLLRIVPTYTTRPPRPAERGRRSPAHRFVSEEEFDELCRQGRLAHVGSIDGLPYRYGLEAITPRRSGPVDAVVLRSRDVRRFVGEVPGCAVYEIDAPDAVLSARLRARGGSPAELSARLEDNARTRRWTPPDGLTVRQFSGDGPLWAVAGAVASAMALDFPGRAAPPGDRRQRTGRQRRTAFQTAGIALAVAVGVFGAAYLAMVAITIVALASGAGSNK